MQITVTGLRNEGKTTVAVVIARALTRLGAEVNYVGAYRMDKEIARLINRDDFEAKVDDVKVTLVDVDVTESLFSPAKPI